MAMQRRIGLKDFDHGAYTPVCAQATGNRLAHARGDCSVWMRLRHDQLRAARLPRFLSHAAIAGQRLGPRRVRPGDRHSEHHMGTWPAVCRDAGRPVRRRPRAVERRHPLCHRPRHDGLFYHAPDAQSVRRRIHRLRARRLCIQHRAVRLRQAPAGAHALAGLRRRRGGRVFWPISLLAARGLACGQHRLAGNAADVRRDDAAHSAVFTRAREWREKAQ